MLKGLCQKCGWGHGKQVEGEEEEKLTCFWDTLSWEFSSNSDLPVGHS